MLKSSHGNASPMQISNTLLPMEELTALSPKPCFATENNNKEKYRRVMKICMRGGERRKASGEG